MSTTYIVKGIRPITDIYKKKLAIYQNCKDLGIEPPDKIREYFENETEPCSDGIIVYLNKDIIEKGVGTYASYYDVDLSKLPEDVTKIRFEILY